MDETDIPLKAPLFGVSVPVKHIRSAVGRNRMKRRIREAYRKNKPETAWKKSGENANLLLFYVYLSNEETPYIEIEKALLEINRRLGNELN